MQKYRFLTMTARVLFFDVSSDKDPHLNAIKTIPISWWVIFVCVCLGPQGCYIILASKDKRSVLLPSLVVNYQTIYSRFFGGGLLIWVLHTRSVLMCYGCISLFKYLQWERERLLIAQESSEIRKKGDTGLQVSLADLGVHFTGWNWRPNII